MEVPTLIFMEGTSEAALLLASAATDSATALLLLSQSEPPGWSGGAALAEESSRSAALTAGQTAVAALTDALQAAEKLEAYIEANGWLADAS